VHENQEKDDRNMELEEEVRYYERDKESIKEFILCTDKVRMKLHEMATDMYTNMLVFQQLETQIMSQHRRA
jgi:hypothetical protein